MWLKEKNNNQREQKYIEIHIYCSQGNELLAICAHIIRVHIYIDIERDAKGRS